jgi:hypothetical protein
MLSGHIYHPETGKWLAWVNDGKITAPAVDPDVKFILDNADRLITVTVRCVISFGLADGLNDRLLATSVERRDDWHQAVTGFHRDTLLMAALRAAVLLDADNRAVSFQAVYHRLKKPSVQAGLLQALEARHGSDDIPPSRADVIEEFRQTYNKIDWKAHGRLTHLRNLGIAHLTPEKMFKSITLEELRTLVAIVSQLATTLRNLCQSQLAFHADMLEEYRDLAKKAIRKAPGV